MKWLFPRRSLAPRVDGRALFRSWPTSAMDALIDRVKRLNAGLLVVSTPDALVSGASTSAELGRDALRVLAGVAAKHRIAVLVAHDSLRRGGADRGVVADP